MSKTLKLFYINNVEKGSMSAYELYSSIKNSVTGVPNFNLTKLTLIDEKPSFANQTDTKKEPEAEFNNINNHPFLKEYLFADALPLVFNEESNNIPQEGVFFEKSISLIMELHENQDKKKLTSLRDKLQEMRPKIKKQDPFSKEKIECEAWINREEGEKVENQKIYLTKNQHCYLKEKKEIIQEEKKSDFDKRKELKILNLEKKFENSKVKIKSFELGVLVKPNIYNPYFDTNKINYSLKNLDYLEPEMEFCFHAKNDSNSQKLFIICRLFGKLEWKIEFSYKFCNAFRFETIDEDEVNLYISFIIPPRFFLYEVEDHEYENPFLREKWERVENFTLFKKKIDGMERLFYMNNSTMRIRMNNNDNLLKLQEKVKRARLLKELTKKIKTREEIKDQDTYLSEFFLNTISFGSEENDFNIRYNLLCLVSENKLSIYDQIMLNKLKSLTTTENNPKVIEKALEDLFRLSKRAYFGDFADQNIKYFRDFAQNINFDVTFDSMYKRSERELKLASSYNDLMLLETRKITITPSGTLFSLKEKEMSNRILRKYKNNLSNFLRVKFADDNLQDTKSMKFVVDKNFRSRMQPFKLLGRNYRLLAFSASQLRASSCWLFFDNSEITVDQIISELGKFNDKLPPKKAARIGQSFAASAPIVLKNFISKKEIEIIDNLPDIYPKTGDFVKLAFSDGIGKISINLMKKITKERKLSFVPSALQIRMGGAKGVLAMDPYLDDNKIYLRKSMIKFDGKNDILEILDYSKFRGGYLNRQIILLLLTLGVKNQVFIDLQNEYIKSLDKCQLKDASIFKYFNADFNGELISLPPITVLIRKLFNADFELQIDPFFLGVERTLRQRGFINLKNKSNILVNKAARLIGVLDEYGVLEKDEVFVQIRGTMDEVETEKDIELIKGKVIVTRNPCLHPGDIRVMNAVYHENLKHFVNCVVFPQKGPRPVTSEISGGDLDGDLFYVSWDERLIPPKIQTALHYIPEEKKFKEKSNITQQDILDFFFDYMNFDILGTVANSHLALADQSEKLANDERCIELSQIHSDAVDYVKTGYCPEVDPKLKAKKWPDFMREKKHLIAYESQTILGILYREVKN